MKKEVLELYGRFIAEREVITLEEYKKRVKYYLFKVDSEFLTDCSDDEVYKLENCFRESIYGKDFSPIFSSVFKKRESVDKYIHEMYDFLLPGFAEEDLDYNLTDAMWWSLTKYKLSEEGEYENICTVDLDAHGKIINVHCAFAEFPPEYDVLKDGEALSFENYHVINIDFPFDSGDILVTNDTPFDDEKYFVYLCDHDITHCRSGHYFIGIDIWDNVFMCQDLDLGQDFTFSSFPLCKIKKATECPIDILNKASKIFTEKPDLLNQLKDIWINADINREARKKLLLQMIETN